MRVNLGVYEDLHHLIFEDLSSLVSRGARQQRILHLAHTGLVIERLASEKGALPALVKGAAELPALETPAVELKAAESNQTSQSELDDLMETFGVSVSNSGQ